MGFVLPDLTYDFDSLEPHVDARTMEIHHGKHHAAYVAKLNAAVEGTEYADQSIDSILKNIEQLPESIRGAVRNNGGGHFNHTLFWTVIGPNAGGEPTGALADAIATEIASSTFAGGDNYINQGDELNTVVAED